LRRLEVNIDTAMVYSDSISAIYIASHPNPPEISKRIDIDCYLVREYIVSGFINLVHVPSKHRLADPLTKALPRPQFQLFIFKLGIHDIFRSI